MVQYKIYYFQGRGAGETARLILAYAGQQFEDVRLTQDEFKADYKSSKTFYNKLYVRVIHGQAGEYWAPKYELVPKVTVD
jgi:hypothetical protein